MGMYERILVPVEGTETDGPVLEHVGGLRRCAARR